MGSDLHLFMLKLKLQHSSRVGELCAELATALGYDEGFTTMCYIMGCLHDVGSLEEIARTGNWEHVEDHGETGYGMLVRGAPFGVLGLDMSLALHAIRYHNRKELVTGDNVFLTILRDADKLAAYEFVNGLVDDGLFGGYCALMWEGRRLQGDVAWSMVEWEEGLSYDWTRSAVREMGIVGKLLRIVEGEDGVGADVGDGMGADAGEREDAHG